MSEMIPSLILAELIAARADRYPDMDIVTFEGGGIRDDQTRTYGQLLDNGYRLAAGLVDRGMQPGDRFALLMRNHPEFVESMIAASIT
ncbi:MAG: AMP-binding protein, partial [Gammaproteobacteria bacterium]|nr:AMP-binding protein [Gammaproteobacteria bacterium]